MQVNVPMSWVLWLKQMKSPGVWQQKPEKVATEWGSNHLTLILWIQTYPQLFLLETITYPRSQPALSGVNDDFLNFPRWKYLPVSRYLCDLWWTPRNPLPETNTFSPLKNQWLKRWIISFWEFAHFQGAFAVSFRECIWTLLQIP